MVIGVRMKWAQTWMHTDALSPYSDLLSLLDFATSCPRSMVTHRRLKDIASAQQAEMDALAAELDKLRLRTYPTFVEPVVASLPPDTKGSLWKT